MRRTLALLVALLLVAGGCSDQLATLSAQKGIKEYFAEVLPNVATTPGIELGATYSDGTPVLTVGTGSTVTPALTEVTVPVENDLEADELLQIHNAAVAATNDPPEHVLDFAKITFVRRSGTTSESTQSLLLHTNDSTYDSIRYWWELYADPDVVVNMGSGYPDPDLHIDASALPDSAPEAVPSIDRLQQILDHPPGDSIVPTLEQWTIRDRGPMIDITARETHLLERALWDHLTVPAPDGVVDSIQINNARSGRAGEIMTGDGRRIWNDVPEGDELTPTAATVTLTSLRSPLFDPEAIRALHAATDPGLRYLQLRIDENDPEDIGYTIDLDMCSAELSEELIAADVASRSEPAPTATIARSTAATTKSLPGFAPGDATDDAVFAAREFWTLLGCQ